MRRRVAIPVFDKDVAPRFCFAQRFLIALLEDGRILERLHVDMGEPDFRSRLAVLAQRGVTHLVCGGFNRTYLPFALGLGVQVSWGHTGDVEQLLERLRAEELDLVAPSPGCGRRQGQGRGHRWRKMRGGRREVPPHELKNRK